jgi:hypothetical protein
MLAPFTHGFSSLGFTMNGLENGFPFCSNPDCELHVYVGQSGVIGSGNWAQSADG